MVKKSAPAIRSLVAISVLGAGAIVSFGLYGSLARASDAKSAKTSAQQRGADVIERPDGSIACQGIVVDRNTQRPISGATVTVRRRVLEPSAEKFLSETRHTTDAVGRYAFDVSPRQAATPWIYLEIEVEHPDYGNARDGRGLNLIRREMKIGETPFFSKLELDAAEPLTARVLSPEGKPLAGVYVRSYSCDKVTAPGEMHENDVHSSWGNSRTDSDGRFRMRMVKGGPGVVWIEPDDFAPISVVADTKRGELGEIRLQKGNAQHGVLLDANDKPVAGAWVNLSLLDQADAHTAAASGSSIERSARTDADGRFVIRPVKPGRYNVQVNNRPYDFQYAEYSRANQEFKNLPAFAYETVTIGDGAEPIVVKARPAIRFDIQYVDSKGAKVLGPALNVWCQKGEEIFWRYFYPDSNGRIEGLLPRGWEGMRLLLTGNGYNAFRIRLGKDQPLIGGTQIFLPKLDHDFDVQIVLYKAPIVLVRCVDQDGKPVPGVKVTAKYADEKRDWKSFDRQSDGRFPSFALVPDDETKIVAEAKGFEDAEKALMLPEGAVEDLVLALKREGPDESAKTSK